MIEPTSRTAVPKTNLGIVHGASGLRSSRLSPIRLFAKAETFLGTNGKIYAHLSEPKFHNNPDIGRQTYRLSINLELADDQASVVKTTRETDPSAYDLNIERDIIISVCEDEFETPGKLVDTLNVLMRDFFNHMLPAVGVREMAVPAQAYIDISGLRAGWQELSTSLLRALQ